MHRILRWAMFRAATAAVVLIGLALAGCRAAAPVQSQTLSDAERATIGDTIRHLYRQSSQTFDSDLDCEQIVDRLAPDGQAQSFVSQGRLVEVTSKGALVGICRAIKQDRVSAHENIQDERVEVLGPDAAVLVVRSIYTVRRRDGRTTARPQVVTTAWSRRSGEWRRVHLHESWLPSDEPAEAAEFIGPRGGQTLEAAGTPSGAPIRVRLP
jgi:hypothetical protein